MVDVTEEFRSTLSKVDQSKLNLDIPGWEVHPYIMHDSFVISHVQAKKGSNTSFMKNGYSHMCLFKIKDKKCNIKVVECANEKCNGLKNIKNCKKNKSFEKIELYLSDPRYVCESSDSRVLKKDIIHISPNCCYTIDVLDDSELLLCMISSDINIKE